MQNSYNNYNTSGFKRTINWNNHQSKTKAQNSPNRYLDYLTDPSFPGVNRLFALAFNANDNKIGHSRYYLPIEKVEDYIML